MPPRHMACHHSPGFHHYEFTEACRCLTKNQRKPPCPRHAGVRLTRSFGRQSSNSTCDRMAKRDSIPDWKELQALSVLHKIYGCGQAIERPRRSSFTALVSTLLPRCVMATTSQLHGIPESGYGHSATPPACRNGLAFWIGSPTVAMTLVKACRFRIEPGRCFIY